jgi:hypothetical protein
MYLAVDDVHSLDNCVEAGHCFGTSGARLAHATAPKPLLATPIIARICLHLHAQPSREVTEQSPTSLSTVSTTTLLDTQFQTRRVSVTLSNQSLSRTSCIALRSRLSLLKLANWHHLVIPWIGSVCQSLKHKLRCYSDYLPNVCANSRPR